MFRKYLFEKSYVQMVSYSEDPMYRKSYVQKYLFRRFYTQKVLYVQKILCSEVFVWKVLYPEGPMFRSSIFRRSFVKKVLCWNTVSASGIKTSRVSFLFPSLLYYSLLLGIHASEFQSYDVLGTSNSKIPQVSGTWKPRTQVPKFCRHAWHFALCFL